MQACVDRGFHSQGLLPGVLQVRRRAPKLFRVLSEASAPLALQVMDWVNAYALAVNEENAAGGRVVTAPTNGAAGIVPAVLMYYRRFESGSSEEGVLRFLLTAAAIGMLYKKRASISGAEMGCRVKLAWPVQWRPVDWSPHSTAPTSRSRTRPRLAWNTILG